MADVCLALRALQLVVISITCNESFTFKRGPKAKECWEKCSLFWKGLRKDCTEMVEIMGCHKQCHHDNSCHRDCPRPQMLWLKEKVEASMACHHELGGNLGGFFIFLLILMSYTFVSLRLPSESRSSKRALHVEVLL